MSVQDERKLRARLGTLLDGIEPRPAPVTHVVRLGRGIRMRRWISVAAGFAVIVAGAALIPSLLQTHRVAPMEQLHNQVTITRPPAAHHGVIGAGVTNGHRWQVRLSGSPDSPTALATGMSPMGVTSAAVGWPASIQGESGLGSRPEDLIAGTVNDRVTRLDILLSAGELVSLPPVSWGGYHWVAVVLPPDARIVRAVAYSGGRELAYAVPYGTVSLVTWWRPGQVPPRRLTKLIGVGRTNGIAWHYVAEIGPWGYCYASGGNTSCDSAASARVAPTGRVVASMSCGALGGGNQSTGPLSGLVAAASGVRRVVLRYSDGTTASFPATEADGRWFVGYGIPAHLSVVHSVEYGASGQVVGSTAGATWEC